MVGRIWTDHDVEFSWLNDELHVDIPERQFVTFKHEFDCLGLAWLKRYGLRLDLLVMRSRGDYAQVTEFKQTVVDDLRSHGFDLRLAFEDDPSNHAMYVAAGVPCVYIHSGYYD